MFKIFSKHRKTLFKINNESRTKKITDVSLSVFIFDLEQFKEVVISGPSFYSIDEMTIVYTIFSWQRRIQHDFNTADAMSAPKEKQAKKAQLKLKMAVKCLKCLF